MNNEILIQGEASLESYAHNIEQKIQIANILLRSGMLPQHYKSPESVITAILYGKELGFSPIRSLNTINVIQGKPTLSAEGLKSLAISHGAKIKTIEWTETICTLECSRGDWVEKLTYSWDDAKRQELTGKDNWRKMPKQMLYARCVSTLVRNMFTDVIAGLYSTEEMQDAIPVKQEAKVIETKPEPQVSQKVLDDKPEWMDQPMPKAEIDIDALANSIENYGGYSFRYNLKDLDLDIKQREWLLKKDFEYDPDTKAWYGNEYIEKLADYIQGKAETVKAVKRVSKAMKGKNETREEYTAN